MLLTSDILLYDSPGLEVKIADKPFNKHILDKDSGSIYSELKPSLTYMLENQDKKFYKKRGISMDA